MTLTLAVSGISLLARGGERRLLGASAERREDVLGELIDRTLLIVTGEVEDEVLEAELEVGADLLDDFLGIRGDDEAGVRLVGVLVGDSLHVDRVLDPLLLLGLQRESRPPLAGLHPVVGVAVVGDLDLDHPADLPASRSTFAAPSSRFSISVSYSSGFLPEVQMKPSPTRPQSFAASGPDAAR